MSGGEGQSSLAQQAMGGRQGILAVVRRAEDAEETSQRAAGGQTACVGSDRAALAAPVLCIQLVESVGVEDIVTL